ncbi:MAG: chromosome segregation protein SMC, partial [Eubacteriales bacterium]|nr:chromosome segregation protein SMC [Eubacteriales bacterium]
MNGSITGVVGPNGSGKSNVSDAVRWVLGEQSAKTLRGSVMQDVIFAGTQKRKPRSYCEVSLIFDNCDGRMSPAYSEIQVTRKLYKSGESEYYINSTRCRLKDILGMFRDTGIGKEGYSIIGQGKIDEILSERAIDRRRVFEEASGIMKYRVRKEEAERKLEKTRYNLIRIEDILQEQHLRIEPLKKQAEDAAAYIELSGKLRHLEINLFLYNYDKGKEKIAKLKQAEQALAEEQAQKELALKQVGTLLLNEQENAKILEQKGDEIAEKLSGSLAEIERVEGEMRLCDERMANLEKDTQRVKNEIADADSKTSAIKQNEAINAQRLKQIEQELEKYQRVVRETSKELIELNSVFEDRVKIIENVQGEKVEAVEKMAEIKSALLTLDEKEKNILQKSEEIAQRLEQLKLETEKNAAALASLNEQLSSSQRQNETLRDTYNQKVFSRNKTSEQIEKTQQVLETARQEYATCAASARLISDLKNSFEGYSNSVKRLMTAAGVNSDIGGRIIGTFADVISVPREYETAIETCLGQALQNIVVNDAYDANHIISFLRQNNMGRVTFLPLGALKQRVLSETEMQAVREQGVLGVAGDIVSCDDSVQSAVAFLLGRTLIADNNETAIRVMRKYNHTFRVVTIEGDVFYPGGSITGGSIRKDSCGLVSRDRREEELTLRAQKLSEKVSSLENELTDNKREHDVLSAEIEDALSSLQKGEIIVATVSEKIESINVAMGEADSTAARLNEEKQALEERLVFIREEIRGFIALQSDMQQSRETKSEDYKRMEDAYNKNAALIEEKKAQLHDAEIKIAGLFKENTALMNDNLRLESEKQETEKAKSAKKKMLELNAQSSDNLQQLKAELEEMHKQKNVILDEIRAQQADIFTKREALSRTLSERDEKQESIRRELGEIKEKSMRVGFNIEKVETGIEAAQNRLWDSYQLTYANALPERDEIDVSGAQTDVDSIKQKIRNIGSVNPNAIEEYTELKERMESMTTQKDDLTGAEQDLHKLIASLLSEMRKIFKSSFEQINRYFNETFQELFDGGSAELLLDD